MTWRRTRCERSFLCCCSPPSSRFPLKAKVTRYLTGNAADVVVPAGRAGPRLRRRRHGRRRGPPVDHRPGARLHELRDQDRRRDPALLGLQRLQRLHLRHERRRLGRDPGDHQRAATPTPRPSRPRSRTPRWSSSPAATSATTSSTSRGRQVETAVESVYARGGGVGGTSAGLAIQGDFSYDGCTGQRAVERRPGQSVPPHDHLHLRLLPLGQPATAPSPTATSSPATAWAGRSAFLARQIQDGKAASALGVGGQRGDLGGGGQERPRDGGRRRPGLLHPRRPRAGRSASRACR